MVKWIDKLSLLVKRLRDAWIEMLPMSSMNETRRQSQHLGDVTRENEERQGRNGSGRHRKSETGGVPHR